jgi:hypothetical protein
MVPHISEADVGLTSPFAKAAVQSASPAVIWPGAAGGVSIALVRRIAETLLRGRGRVNAQPNPARLPLSKNPNKGNDSP